MSASSTETSVEALSRIIFRESKPGNTLQTAETEQAAVEFLQLLSPDNYLSGRSYTRLKPNATKESRLGNRCEKFIKDLETGSGVTAGQWFIDQKGSQAPRCSNAPNCHGARSSANEAVSTFFQIPARSTSARLESLFTAKHLRLHSVVSCGRLECLIACHKKWNEQMPGDRNYSRAEWWARQITELEKLKPEGMSVDQWIDEGDDDLYGTIRLRITEPYKGTLPATDIYPEKTIDWEGLQSHVILCRKAESGEAGSAG